jgi:hypothetical protein
MHHITDYCQLSAASHAAQQMKEATNGISKLIAGKNSQKQPAHMHHLLQV